MAASPLGDRLASLTPPWVHLWVADDDARATLPAPPPGFAARTLDGRRGRTKRTLLDEMARVLAFPAHFGRSWDALEDCLTDLTWLPATGYRLEIGVADRVLARDPRGYATLIALLEDVGRAWATGATGHPGRPAVPFHTVLVVTAARLNARPSWGVPTLVG
jgi:RNAse (barnase) inhibitor barstar